VESSRGARSAARQHGLGQQQIQRRSDLECHRVAIDNLYRRTGLLDERGVVGETTNRRALIRTAQHVDVEALRRLDGTQTGPFRRSEHRTVGVDRLDRVGQRQTRDDGTVPGLESTHDTDDQRSRSQSPGRIVDQYEFGVTRGLQGQPDRLGTVDTARHDLGGSAEDQFGLIGERRRHRDDNSVDDPRCTQAVESMLKQRFTAQFDEGLRPTRT